MLAGSLNDSERFLGSTVSQATELEGETSVFLRRAFHRDFFRSMKFKKRFVPILILPH